MIKAIIIDDEQHCIDRITDMLQRNYADTIRLLAPAVSVKEGIIAIKEHQPDLIFLDVQIQDRTGFDLLRECGKINFKIIFSNRKSKCIDVLYYRLGGNLHRRLFTTCA